MLDAAIDDEPAGPDSDSTADARVLTSRREHRFTKDLLLLLAYVAVSLWLWRSMLPHLATRTIGGGSLDPGMFIWWMNWTPFALWHGLDPFRSTYLDAPAGVSAMWNSSVLTLGLLFAPVTATLGPVAGFNLACILGPPLSAWTAALWLRRHVRAIAAAVGGLVFGFSPFVIAHSHAGHLNFTWLCLLPVIVMLTEDLLWRSARPIWPQAPLLGVVFTLQFLLSSEALLITSVGCAALAIALAAANLDVARQRLRVVLPAVGVAAATAAVLCAWPLVEQLGGRHAIHEPIHEIGSSGGRIGMLVSASDKLAFHADRYPAGHLTSIENGLYIGWPLLVLLAATVIVLRRRRGVLIAAAVGVVAISLQLERTRWHVGGLSIPTPLSLVQEHSSIGAQIQPGRYGIVMWFAIVWLLALALDTAITRVPKRWLFVPAAVTFVCILSLLPGAQTPILNLPKTPAFFTTSMSHIIPEGSTVMIAPMTTVTNTAGETWQIDTGMRFRLVGGYMLHASVPSGVPSYGPSAKALVFLFGIRHGTSGPYTGHPTPALLARARAELRAAGVSMFIVSYSRYGEATHLALAQQLFGRPADQRIGGVSIWRLSRA